MRLPATLVLVLRRARAHPAPVVAVALDVLVVCTLVAALAASLGLLQRDALRSALAAAPVEETVLTATAPYDEDDPGGQDAAVRDALAPVVEVAGGDVVGVAESGTYDVTGPAAGGGATTLAAVTGAGDRLRVAEGELPVAGASGGPLAVAVPADSGLALGDRLTLRQRADEREVAVEVVGRWALPEDQQRWLADVDPTSMLVAPDRLGDLAGTGAAARWRAVPEVTALGTGELAPMADAAAGTLTALEAVAEERGGSVQAETGLVQAMADRTRELTTLRALLLVPAALLVLVAGAGLLLVAAGLADVRREEESLLRSRGAGQRQLTGPTVLETLVVCGPAAALAPLVAALVVRIDGVRPPLALSGWVASGAAAIACAAALVVPVAIRAATGDRGRQETAERLRRRRLTVLATVLMLVVALGALAVAELRGFGDSLGSGTATAATDPLLVAAPALLLLALAVVAGLLVVPPALRLVARLAAGRDAPVVLGTRFAARATGRTVPLALAVTLATGTLAFASLEASSSAASRTDRAAYVTGGDVRVGAPPDAQRAGAAVERSRLVALDGVTDVVAVHRGGTFLDDLAADVVVADLAGHPGMLLGEADDDVVAAAVDPGLDDVGVDVPPGTRELSVAVRSAGTGALQVVLAGPDGGLTAVAGASGQNPLVVDVTGLPEGTRLVAAVTEVQGEPDSAAGLEVLADGEPLEVPASWWVLDDTAVVVAADAPPPAPGALPAVVTEDLAEAASLEVGDTVGLTALGVPAGIEVAATVPAIRTVADGSGGILLDAGTALPLLLAGGLDGAPDEWWLGVADGAGDRVAAALATEPDLAASVTSRGAELDRLDVDPGTGGAALGRVLLVTGVGCLLVGALLLVSIVLLRRRERGEQARMLGVAGGDRRLLSGVVAWEYGVVAAVGLVVGLLAGAVVAAVTLAATTLGPGGGPLQPAPRLSPAPLTLLLPPLVMLAVPLLAMLWTVRRDHPRGLGLVDGQGVRR